MFGLGCSNIIVGVILDQCPEDGVSVGVEGTDDPLSLGYEIGSEVRYLFIFFFGGEIISMPSKQGFFVMIFFLLFLPGKLLSSRKPFFLRLWYVILFSFYSHFILMLCFLLSFLLTSIYLSGALSFLLSLVLIFVDLGSGKVLLAANTKGKEVLVDEEDEKLLYDPADPRVN